MNGRSNISTILAGVFGCLFLVAAGFGVWAFMGRQDYKNNVDQKITAAIAVAQQQTSDKKDAEFLEREKTPFRIYGGPSAYGSVSITYPKTWSAYVDETGKSSLPVDGYFNPATVPGIQSGSNFAIRLQVINQQYAQEIRSLDSGIKAGKSKASPYVPPKVSTVTGIRVDGEVTPNKKGSMVILPMCDKTLKVWAESDRFVGDLDKIILPNLVFVP